MVEVYKKMKGESEAEFRARKARHEAQEKKLAARDPSIPVVLHERFEAIEERFEELEAKIAKLFAKATLGAAAQQQAPPAVGFQAGLTELTNDEDEALDEESEEPKS